MRQLPLQLRFRDDATFDSFYAGQNQAIITYLKSPKENFLYLYGKPCTGLTHLLQAICRRAENSLYLPLNTAKDFSPAILQNIETLDLLAIDDIDSIAGDLAWEEALFHSFNRLQAANKRLAITSHCLPRHLPLVLPDLASRLQSLLMLTINSLDDKEKIAVLQHRASLRGIVLAPDVGQFILTHTSRDMASLLATLNTLDSHSLAMGRRFSIPFVKTVLGI